MERVTTDSEMPEQASTQAATASPNIAFDMIANCAHDLKTPLAAIYSSNQLTISILSDIQAIIEQMNPAPAGVLNDLEIAKSTLQASINMTEFMKMSINRCMDFTKVQNHAMKLSPKCETVDIAEALQLPLNCMMTVDPDQIIELKPMPQEMCSHVITDLQWLQENVLCLTSNAAKYSSRGTITLSVSICSESSLGVTGQQEEHDWVEQAGSSSKSAWNESPSAPLQQPLQAGDGDAHVCLPERLAAPASFYGLGEDNTTTTESAFGSADRMMVVVECEDSGIGLSDEAMANLFAPFKQAQRLAGGTGLGLFSLANRMEALQGLCGVCGRRDGAQGSLFWFAFPYKPDEEAADAAQEQDLTAEHLAQLSALNIDTSADGRQHVFDPFASFGTFDKKHHRKEVLSVCTLALPYCGSYGDTTVTPKQDWHGSGSRARKLNNTVTPRASRQLAARPPHASPRPTPCNSCPPSPAESDLHGSSTIVAGQSPAASTGDCEGHTSESALLHILLVDDTPSILKICSRTLMREGFKVTTAENGYEALKLLNQTKFDAVLMDLHMPVMDGLETVRRYRAAEALTEGSRRQFIVAVSASADPTIARGVMEVGFDGYIEKPFSIKVLHAILPFDFGIAARTQEFY